MYKFGLSYSYRCRKFSLPVADLVLPHALRLRPTCDGTDDTAGANHSRKALRADLIP